MHFENYFAHLIFSHCIRIQSTNIIQMTNVKSLHNYLNKNIPSLSPFLLYLNFNIDPNFHIFNILHFFFKFHFHPSPPPLLLFHISYTFNVTRSRVDKLRKKRENTKSFCLLSRRITNRAAKWKTPSVALSFSFSFPFFLSSSFSSLTLITRKSEEQLERE